MYSIEIAEIYTQGLQCGGMYNLVFLGLHLIHCEIPAALRCGKSFTVLSSPGLNKMGIGIDGPQNTSQDILLMDEKEHLLSKSSGKRLKMVERMRLGCKAAGAPRSSKAYLITCRFEKPNIFSSSSSSSSSSSDPLFSNISISFHGDTVTKLRSFTVFDALMTVLNLSRRHPDPPGPCHYHHLHLGASVFLPSSCSRDLARLGISSAPLLRHSTYIHTNP